MTTVSIVVNGENCEEERCEENGDARINMVSGFNCLGKMTDSIALKEKSENFQIELKNALTGVLNSEQKKSDKEMQYLKELIVSHLDVIQQQSEQLAIKDRLISKLKNEKDMLSMRLQRMERRVNLERSRGSGDELKESKPPVSLDLSAQSLRPALPASATSRLQRRPSMETAQPTTQGKPAKQQPLSSTSLPQSLSHPPPSKKLKRRHSPDDIEGAVCKNPSKLITESLYYTSVGEQECRWIVEHQQAAKPINLLEVPSWRTKVYSSSYTMEGTENLSDEVFERRHANLYKDEKRRKRWDVQRIREMRHNERLRQRQNGSGNGGGKADASLTESLWPRPTRHTQLIVQQSVPVAAFGITLHALPHRDFSFSSFTLPSSKYPKLSRRAKR